MELMGGLGQMLGPVLGGGLYDAADFKTPFLAVGCMYCLATLASIVALPSRSRLTAQLDTEFLVRSSSTRSLPRFGSSRSALTPSLLASIGALASRDSMSIGIFDVLRCRSVQFSFVIAALAQCFFSYLDPTLEPHLQPYGLNQAMIGLFFLLLSACYTFGAPAAGKLADRSWGPKFPMMLGMVVMSAGLTLLGPAYVFKGQDSNVVLQTVGLALLGFGVGLSVVPTFSDMIAATQHLGPGAATVVAGLSAAMFSCGQTIGPLVGSLLCDLYGFRWTATIFACLSRLLSFLLSFLSHSDFHWRIFRRRPLASGRCCSVERSAAILPGGGTFRF